MEQTAHVVSQAAGDYGTCVARRHWAGRGEQSGKRSERESRAAAAGRAQVR